MQAGENVRTHQCGMPGNTEKSNSIVVLVGSIGANRCINHPLTSSMSEPIPKTWNMSLGIPRLVRMLHRELHGNWSSWGSELHHI